MAAIDERVPLPDEQVRSVDENLREYFFPNKMGRIIFLGLEQVMGRNGINAILNLACIQHRIGHYPPNNFDKELPFDEVGRLMQALEEMYGPRGGRGLARRAGWACFKLGIQDFGPMLGLADLTFRILPLEMKMRLGFEVLAQTFNKFSDHLIRLGEDDQYFYWIMERCGACWGRRTDSPCCYLAVGVLEEGLHWIGGGQNFYVEEVSCVATGDQNCTIVIGKRPLE